MRKRKVKLWIAVVVGAAFSLALPWIFPEALAKPPKSSVRSKFYDFNEQLIDGEIKKPANLYVNSRQKVKFERLLKLKKSFLPQLFDTAKERVFK